MRRIHSAKGALATYMLFLAGLTLAISALVFRPRDAKRLDGGASSGEAADAASLGGKLSFIDRDGNDLDETAVPRDLREYVWRQKLGRRTEKAQSYSIVLARVLVPPGEPDPNFARSLDGRGWNGASQCELGMRSSTVCMPLSHLDAPSTFAISKPGYKTIEVPVPFLRAAGRIVWMGEFVLERYSEQDDRTVNGTVAREDGSPLFAPGEATIRVNSMEAFQRVSLVNGTFSFPKVTPGKYLVEFWIDRYSVETWWVTVPVDGPSTINGELTAYGRYQLKGLWHTQGQPARLVEIELGIPYKDASIQLGPRPADSVRANQIGHKVSFYSSSHKLTRDRRPFRDLQSTAEAMAGARPWFSWLGEIESGDSIVLFDSGRAPGIGKDTSPAEVFGVLEIKELVAPR